METVLIDLPEDDFSFSLSEIFGVADLWPVIESGNIVQVNSKVEQAIRAFGNLQLSKENYRSRQQRSRDRIAGDAFVSGSQIALQRVIHLEIYILR
ncbi:uncharacterized protein RCO7_02525 [Rhynchosporium graminicola]|uniref:Uncharacterized protein n=1 Tax=Rhynchosporium graminicola TaxID=2792576 RepID=A0A1E1JUS0_9HELO|nr:uncharacterized protein RCO7_02525 [Rhynchosporium commune]